MYGSLRTYSHFSFLRGASSPEELVARAVELGHDAMCLADINGVYGAVRFQHAGHYIISVHLLVVLIGAAYMARPKRRVTEAAAQD